MLNMLSDGTNTYLWDPLNRLIQITYPGSGNNSKFFYDGFSGLVKIVETTSGSVTSTKQFVRCGSQICEERNASGSVIKQFFGGGQTISGTIYFYTRDHLGSVRDLTDGSGNLQAHYEYDMWGLQTKTSGSLDADFGYAGYYEHSRSGLNLTANRAYKSSMARWINRDPFGEYGGVNLYEYASSSPVTIVDPSGLAPHWYTPSEFQKLTGTPASYIDPSNPNAVGCVGVVDAALGIPPGVLPEWWAGSSEGKANATTQCWWGGQNGDPTPAASQACKHKCKPGEKEVIWCKQGAFNGTPGAPGSPNESPASGWAPGTAFN